MLDFEQSRKEALDYLDLTESAQKLSDEAVHRLVVIEKKELKLAMHAEVWELATELLMKNGFEVVKLYIGLPSEFPLILPTVYLSQYDRERLKYLPHVDDDGEVCGYHDDSVHLDWKRPGAVVKECVIRAKKVLEQGLICRNPEEFEEEFSAYWEQIYGSRDKVRTELSMLVNSELPAVGLLNITVMKRQGGYEGYNFIVHNNSSTEFKRLRQYLTDAHYEFDDREALFLGIAKNPLPFNETNKSALEFIAKEFPQLITEFQHYVSRGKSPMVIVFARAVKGNYIFYGWQIGPFRLDRPGFRKKILTPWFVFSTLDAQSPVVRLKFDTFTTGRLNMRTDGVPEPEAVKRIAVVGLGSIGSNVIPYLTSLQVERLDLIDPDILVMENINRHLLGINYINRYKAFALEEYLRSSNPLLNVKGHNSSIVSFFETAPNILVKADLVVVCVGRTNIEEYIVSRLADMNATNAIAVIWVEPFLVGAHCLYLRPNQKADLSRLFDEGIFKFNVVASSEYQNRSNDMLLKEGGCQTSYIPYGRQSVTRFLATLMPHLFDLIESPAEKDFLFTFKGARSVIDRSSLLLSPIGQKLAFNTINKIGLNDDPDRQIQY